MNGKPLGRYVLVEVKEIEEKTAGGIVIPVQAKEAEERLQDVGTVVAFGPLACLDDGGTEEYGARIGQKVMFKRQGGVIVQYPGMSKQLRLLNDEDLLMEIEDD